MADPYKDEDIDNTRPTDPETLALINQLSIVDRGEGPLAVEARALAGSLGEDPENPTTHRAALALIGEATAATEPTAEQNTPATQPKTPDEILDELRKIAEVLQRRAKGYATQARKLEENLGNPTIKLSEFETTEARHRLEIIKSMTRQGYELAAEALGHMEVLDNAATAQQVDSAAAFVQGLIDRPADGYAAIVTEARGRPAAYSK